MKLRHLASCNRTYSALNHTNIKKCTTTDWFYTANHHYYYFSSFINDSQRVCLQLNTRCRQANDILSNPEPTVVKRQRQCIAVETCMNS